MAMVPDGLRSSSRRAALREPISSGSSDNCRPSRPSKPKGEAASIARTVLVNGHHIASPGLREVLEQASGSANIATSAGADEAILALRQSPPELVVFLKGVPAATLVFLLSKAFDGEPSATANGAPHHSPGAIFRDGADALSEREREVAKWAAAGARNKEIAWRLGISEGTVKLHLFRAYRKLRVTNRVGLALALGGPPKESEPDSKP